MKFNFEDCRVVDELNVPEALVQITADETEVQRRIEAFINQKRGEINQNNLTDFLEQGSENSCARVNSNVYRIKDSKGHLRIKRVKNEVGPLTESSKLVKSDESTNFCSINERLKDSESFLKLESNSIPKDIYERLKKIEDQISHLQSVSPEYSQFFARKDSAAKKNAYSAEDLDRIIASMES